MGLAVRAIYLEGARMHNAATDEVSLTQAGILRFENWHAWASGGEKAMILRHYYPRQIAACALYRSTEVHADIDDEPPVYVDKDDALTVDRALCQLPSHLKTAVTNKYLGRPRILNIPHDVLDGWVAQAARLLMERWP